MSWRFCWAPWKSCWVSLLRFQELIFLLRPFALLISLIFPICALFRKSQKTARWIFFRLSLCILDVVNNVSSKFRYDWLYGTILNSAIKMAVEGTETFALQSHDWLFILIYSICTTFFRDFPAAHLNANVSYSLRLGRGQKHGRMLFWFNILA